MILAKKKSQKVSKNSIVAPTLKLEFWFALIPDQSETPCKREIDKLTNEMRKTQEWIEENDVSTQYDQYFVTEIQERRSKILEESQRSLRYEGLIESYNEQLQKVLEDIEALGVDDDALKKRVDKQKNAIAKMYCHLMASKET